MHKILLKIIKSNNIRKIFFLYEKKSLEKARFDKSALVDLDENFIIVIYLWVERAAFTSSDFKSLKKFFL